MDAQPKVRICVPVCETTIAGAREALIRAREGADILELRLDCLEPLELERATKLKALLANLGIPVIITLRPAGQGGSRELDFSVRKASGRAWEGLDHIYRDMELDLLEHISASLNPAQVERLICSHHDFAGVPADLDQIYERMSRTKAAILKLAVQSHDITDCLPMFRLLDRARKENRDIIAIAMGPAGVATRILGPSRGAFLTYGSLDEQSATAPAQLNVTELRDLYRIQKINYETAIMGLVGMPVTHSVSPHMHNAALESARVNGVYIPFPVKNIGSFIRRMVSPQTREIDWYVRGFSVTAPHKSSVMTFLDWIEPSALEIGAVNTIIVEKDALRGYNTDASAFLQTISQECPDLADARCAIIGAGGSASAVAWALTRAGAEVTVFGRDENKTAQLAARFKVKTQTLKGARFGEFELVVNATPLGTSGSLEDQSPATSDQLRGARVACDLVYNPQQTSFLLEARAAGCKTIGGLAMLVSQAAEQFQLWTKLPAPENVMLDVARKALENT